MSLVRGGVLDGHRMPVQTVQLGPGGGLIGLDHGHVVRLLGLGQPGDVGLHGDHPSPARGCGGMAVSQPGSHGRIECVGVETLEDPADRRPGRRMPPAQQVTAHAERGEQPCVGAGAPLGEFVDGPGSRDRGGRADQQDRGQRVPAAPPGARIGHCLQEEPQVRHVVRIERTQLGQHGRDRGR